MLLLLWIFLSLSILDTESLNCTHFRSSCHQCTLNSCTYGVNDDQITTQCVNKVEDLLGNIEFIHLSPDFCPTIIMQQKVVINMDKESHNTNLIIGLAVGTAVGVVFMIVLFSIAIWRFWIYCKSCAQPPRTQPNANRLDANDSLAYLNELNEGLHTYNNVIDEAVRTRDAAKKLQTPLPPNVLMKTPLIHLDDLVNPLPAVNDMMDFDSATETTEFNRHPGSSKSIHTLVKMHEVEEQQLLSLTSSSSSPIIPEIHVTPYVRLVRTAKRLTKWVNPKLPSDATPVKTRSQSKSHDD